jgi:hypothetical protein
VFYLSGGRPTGSFVEKGWTRIPWNPDHQGKLYSTGDIQKNHNSLQQKYCADEYTTAPLPPTTMMTTCILINVAISRNRNAKQKESKKTLKYKDFTIEIWQRKVTPVITGATGTISESIKKNT